MRKILLTLAAAGFLLAPQKMQAKVTHLLPRPQQVATQTGTFALGGTVSITDPTNCKALQEFFKSVGCTIADGGTPVTVQLVTSIAGAYDYELVGFENEARDFESGGLAYELFDKGETVVVSIESNRRFLA
ncbi:MAG: hypothetical protein UHL07_00630, partial [Bacteroidaceae bacterium]|nr:hypothetical protein [Bacteroidaceae bacterium]